jgi:hypothetical protein
MTTLCRSLAIVIVLCAAAHAGTNTAVTFDTTAGSCSQKTSEIEGKDQLTFAVTPPSPGDIEVRVLRATGDSSTIVVKGTVVGGADGLANPMSYDLKVGDVVVADIGGNRKCQLIVVAATPKAPETGSPEPQAETKDKKGPSPPDTTHNGRALIYLANLGITDHVRTGGSNGHSYKLYHLPDGSPAFPLPSNVSEEDELEVWIVQLVGLQSTAEITECKDVPTVRIIGSFAGASEIIGGTKKVKSSELVEPPLELRRISAPIKCGESVAYKVTGNGATRDVSFKIAPVYRFSWGVAYGFDFGRPTKLTLVERPMTSGSGTERVIVEDRQRSGFRPMATLTVNACRANPKDWDACDAFGLTGLIDITKPLDGAGLGVKIQPWPGLGFIVGMTVFRADQIAPGHAMKPGDVFTGSGDLPLEPGFNERSFGLFLGVGGDTDTVKSLF